VFKDNGLIIPKNSGPNEEFLGFLFEWRWISGSVTLQQQLPLAVYHKGQKILTPKQVELIFEYLGMAEYQLNSFDYFKNGISTLNQRPL
jgi:hypothetical protein